MAFRMHTNTDRVIRRTAALAALSLATLACSPVDGDAQATRLKGIDVPVVNRAGYSPGRYPLDEATVRKVVAVMRAWTPPRPERRKAKEGESFFAAAEEALLRSFPTIVVRELMIENSTATIDGTATLKAAIASQGLSSRTFAEALCAYKEASVTMAVADISHAQVGKDGYTPGPVLTKNMDLIRRMQTSEGLAYPSGW